MTGEKTSFGRPKLVDQAELPPHLRGKGKTATLLQNATVEDFAWLGQDGELDVDGLMDELCSPQALLRAVVVSVIKAYPNTPENLDERLKSAMASLTGRSRARGRSETDRYDDDVRAMAEAYFLGFVGLDTQAPSLNALAHSTLSFGPAYNDRDDEQKGDRRKALRERFAKQRDRLLVRMTADESELRETLAKVNRAVDALRELGIGALPLNLEDVFGAARGVGAPGGGPTPVKGNN